MENISELKDVVSIVSSIALVLIGISGLETWKRQLRGNTARDVLRAVYKTRDAIRHVRNPFMSSAEHLVALQKSGFDTEKIIKFDDELQKRASGLAYQYRWEKIAEAMTKLNLAAFEAEVLWEKKVIVALNPLRKSVGELNWALQTYLEKRDGLRDIKMQERVEKIVFGFEDLLEDNKTKNDFSNEVVNGIKEIEEFIRPRLKL